MSMIEKTLITLGLALVLGAGGSAIVQSPSEVPPIVIAREAEAVTRAVRIWMKKPVPGPCPAASPIYEVVACRVQDSTV